MKTLTANIMGMIFFIFIGVWFLVNSLLLPESEGAADVGPSAFPILSAVGLIIASLFYLINELRNRKKDTDEKITMPNRNKVVSAIGILIAYLLVMELLGYYIASIIAIPLLLFVSGVKNVMKLGVLSIGFLVFIYIGFDTLLGIPMP